MNRILLIASCGVLGLLGCSRPAGFDFRAVTPATGDRLVVRMDRDPESLNPMLMESSNAEYAAYGMNNSQIYEKLLQFDTKDWSFTKPLLAESFPELSVDHLQYTFTLRDGILWHDGEALTAEDVLFSAKALVCPFAASDPLRENFSEIADVEILPGRKIRFTFKQPNVVNVYTVGGLLPIIARHRFDPDGLLNAVSYKDLAASKLQADHRILDFARQFHENYTNRVAVGTGPYVFKKWDIGSELILARNDRYWGAKASLGQIDYRIVGDPVMAMMGMRSGEIDFNPKLTPAQYAEDMESGDLAAQYRKLTISNSGYYYIDWNVDRPVFADKRVRQALTMSIDRGAVISGIRLGLAMPTESPVNPGSPSYNTRLTPYPYDPARASRLLDEAGWKDTNGDGVRDKDGVPLRFEMLGVTTSEFTDRLLPILKNAFREVGIEMTERRQEFSAFTESQRTRAFDAGIAARVVGMLAEGGASNIGFRNEEASRLLERARTEFDATKRRELYWQWQEIVYDEQPYTFLFVPLNGAAVQKRLQNVKSFPLTPGYDMISWFVPQGMQKNSLVPAQ